MDRTPDARDYLALFARYPADFAPGSAPSPAPSSDAAFGTVYRAPEDARFRLLFEQVCALLTRPSPFNLHLPEAFRTTAQRYRAGDPATRAQMQEPQNRHFMLSDLFDYIHLVDTMGGGWNQRGR
ncbi:hypothetical protein MTR62_19415 [Novosphingobium sp. 1949]|uniref:Uncharacterized protein n=1 Tax=Novosphingobium organovorum TaxID=2930092 RepID=A0ABT0BIF5_9SPHN|nr:hypothetical protein [Novosphingobium organovorum]MCJ2184841.1 hypothetical protein [Novosphingobium organovorum]